MVVGRVLPAPRSPQILRNTTSEFFHPTKQLGRQLGSAQSLDWVGDAHEFSGGPSPALAGDPPPHTWITKGRLVLSRFLVF